MLPVFIVSFWDNEVRYVRPNFQTLSSIYLSEASYGRLLVYNKPAYPGKVLYISAVRDINVLPFENWLLEYSKL